MKNKKIIGIIISIISSLTIFIASLMNRLTPVGTVSQKIYIFDVISSIAIVTLTIGIVLIFKDKKKKNE
jgi:hypothetical protein